VKPSWWLISAAASRRPAEGNDCGLGAMGRVRLIRLPLLPVDQEFIPDFFQGLIYCEEADHSKKSHQPQNRGNDPNHYC
jgi:hypothetical protein